MAKVIPKLRITDNIKLGSTNTILPTSGDPGMVLNGLVTINMVFTSDGSLAKPPGFFSCTAKCWGGGSGGGAVGFQGVGGGGGYGTRILSGTYETIHVHVGGNGRFGQPSTGTGPFYGSHTGSSTVAGSGGGGSAVFTHDGASTYTLQACGAGGGGTAAGGWGYGGGNGGGGSPAVDGYAGSGGTGGDGGVGDTGTGIDGTNSYLTRSSLGAFLGGGGNSDNGGGGGGGGYGGGGGGGWGSAVGNGGGGGNYGSSTTNGGNGDTGGIVANSGDADYISGYGDGGAQASDGEPGLVVLLVQVIAIEFKQGISAKLLRPSLDNKYGLGDQDKRWADIWVASGTISTSDLADKTDIKDCIGTELIKKVRAVTFKYKDGARPHCGFIAQDIEAALKELKADFGVLVKGSLKNLGPDDEKKNVVRYGLRYEEFLASIVQTIHEINWRIENIMRVLGRAKMIEVAEKIDMDEKTSTS